MKRILLEILILCLIGNCFGQDTILPTPEFYFENPEQKFVREYFFENLNFTDNGKELVIIVKEPQTKLAEEFGYRIYSDTNFLSKIEAKFYRDIDPTYDEMHFCGYDVYFYIKSGKNLKLFKQINSMCGINELGCENLEFLANNGRMLTVDTLQMLDFESLKAKEIIPEEVVYSEFVTSEGTWQDFTPLFYNNCSKPNWYYDGKFQAILEVNNVRPINEYIQQFFKHVDSLEFKNINYSLEYEDEKQLHIFNSTSPKLTSLRLNVYLDKDCYHYFEEYKILSNKTKRKIIKIQDGFFILLKN